MARFKGFDDYVEIFRGGEQTDSGGRKHDGDAIIDKAVSSFSSSEHEPPLVAGHPKDNSPAYGWVEDIKSEARKTGKVLLAKFKEVTPEFEELVKGGQFKKRSAAFYPDGSLRHVGFLGAVPPAVKGLADMNFDEGDPVTFEFYDYKTSVIARMFGGLREFLIEEKGVETADRVIPTWDVDSLKEEAMNNEVDLAYSEPQQTEEPVKGNNKGTGDGFTQADLDAAKVEAKEEAKQEAATEFAEQQKADQLEKAKLAITTFCEKTVKEGGPLPAWIDGGLKEFMESLAGGEVIQFCEGEDRPSLDWFMDFISGLKPVEFGEHAKKEDLPDTDDYVAIAKKATEFKDTEAKAGRVISFTEAVAHVSSE